MCSDPVTFGGGMTSENTRPGALAEARKMPKSIHHWAQCGSNRWGSYTFSICMGNYQYSKATGHNEPMSTSPEITHVSDTALMVAACRALETARPDGFVHDPFAERLAGERGMAITRSLPFGGLMMCFGVGVRSRYLDDIVLRTVAEHKLEVVVCLGCGLDTRPWRLDLPVDLRWIEVDFQDMLDYKGGLMAAERPKCRLERMAVDVNDAAGRREIFTAAGAAPALMITEGLLMYLPAATVNALASEPVGQSGIRYWTMDVTTSAFARLLQMDSYQGVESVRDPDHLYGEQMLELFARHGWTLMCRRDYVNEPREFAAGRIRRMFGLPEGAPLPPSQLPDDPSGVHLFGHF